MLSFLLFVYIIVQKLRDKDAESKTYLYQLEQQLAIIQHSITIKNKEITDLTIQKVQLDITLHTEREAHKKEIEFLIQSEERIINTFKHLSIDALQKNSNHFMNLAKDVLDSKIKETHSDFTIREEKMHEVVRPIQERLEKFDNEIRSLEKERAGAYAGMREQILLLINQTTNLAHALSKPHIRGKWGEMQLKRVVEMAGMIEHCDFLTQPTIRDKHEDTILRPDVVIKMPSGKQIIIDAKVPLDSYLDALAQKDVQLQKIKLKHHALTIKKHIQSLAKKEYWNQFDNTPELVILFLTGEGVFSAALEYEPSLIEIGIENKVMIATPITLIALLRAVAYGWKQEMISENAKQISELGHIIYERMCTMSTHFDNLRKSLKNAVEHYNHTAHSLESRIFPSVRTFTKLGIHTHSKHVIPAKIVESSPYVLHVKEL
ncbi:DNA recombination protein RmuC [Wolbachia endosymbiont of Howardula sp.]|uniref:DNA recombination protein RmuC n=1 Tax=Wolbachia endosymbiont of Howardula sp. TaxID=2916816 RepID=UPI0039789695